MSITMHLMTYLEVFGVKIYFLCPFLNTDISALHKFSYASHPMNECEN